MCLHSASQRTVCVVFGDRVGTEDVYCAKDLAPACNSGHCRRRMSARRLRAAKRINRGCFCFRGLALTVSIRMKRYCLRSWCNHLDSEPVELRRCACRCVCIAFLGSITLNLVHAGWRPLCHEVGVAVEGVEAIGGALPGECPF